ncbi:MAG: hypothetical protein L0Z49_12755 [Actinobacteria bacterium]|nr:hypothetical protein [Actinomycetota bacterium]
MAFESDVFYDLMTDTVTISTRTTQDLYGSPSFSTGVARRARVVEKQGMVRTSEDKAIEYTHVAWVHSTGNTAAVDDRVTLDGVNYLVIKMVERYPDEDGAHHVKFLLGY